MHSSLWLQDWMAGSGLSKTQKRQFPGSVLCHTRTVEKCLCFSFAPTQTDLHVHIPCPIESVQLLWEQTHLHSLQRKGNSLNKSVPQVGTSQCVISQTIVSQKTETCCATEFRFEYRCFRCQIWTVLLFQIHLPRHSSFSQAKNNKEDRNSEKVATSSWR